MMRTDREPEFDEASDDEVYETGDFVALFCGEVYGIEHWVCPVSGEVIPFSGFVFGPGKAAEDATDRYAIDPDASVPVIVEATLDPKTDERVVTFRQAAGKSFELEETELDIHGGRPASYPQTLLATAIFGVVVAIVLRVARRLSAA